MWGNWGVRRAQARNVSIERHRPVLGRGAGAAMSLALTATLLSGCATDDEPPVASASPSPSASPSATASAPPATPPASPSATPSASPSPTSEPSPQPSATATATPTAAPSPTATAAPALRGLRFDIACDRMLTAQQVYDYNPNVGVDPNYRVRANSGPARTVELSGTACGWVNQTSGETISIGVARFDRENFDRVRATARSAGGTSRGLGMDGHYRMESGLGVVDAFTGLYWIAAESSSFLAPEDVAPLLESIRRNLP